MDFSPLTNPQKSFEEALSPISTGERSPRATTSQYVSQSDAAEANEIPRENQNSSMKRVKKTTFVEVNPLHFAPAPEPSGRPTSSSLNNHNSNNHYSASGTTAPNHRSVLLSTETSVQVAKQQPLLPPQTSDPQPVVPRPLVYPSSQPVSPQQSDTEEMDSPRGRAAPMTNNSIARRHRGSVQQSRLLDDATSPQTAARYAQQMGTEMYVGGGKKKRQRIKKHAVKIHAYATAPNAYYPARKGLHDRGIGGSGMDMVPDAMYQPMAFHPQNPSMHSAGEDRVTSLQQPSLGMSSPQTPAVPSPAFQSGNGGPPNAPKGVSTPMMANNSIYFNSMNLFQNALSRNQRAIRGGPNPWNDESLNYTSVSERGGDPRLSWAGQPQHQSVGLFMPPPRFEGRRWESKRYALPQCPPYRIPLYDQAVFKYVFDSLYANHLTLMQVLFLLVSFAMFALNVIMTVVNVLYAVSLDDEISAWIVVAATACFILEFAVAAICLLLLVVVMAEAIIFNNIGTSLAYDISFLVTLGGTFSVLRLTGLATPVFALRRIVPLFQRAVTLADWVIAIVAVLAWMVVMVTTFIVLVAKMSQIYFTLVLPIPSWTLMEYIRLVGLCVNLSRVDDSYFKEMSVLLDAIHKHYSFPGEAEEAHPYEKPCLINRIRIKLRLPMYMYFTFFDTIYNFHWRSKYEREGLILQLRHEETERKRKDELRASEQAASGGPTPREQEARGNSTANFYTTVTQMRERAAAVAEKNVKEDERALRSGKRYRKTRLSRGKRLWLMFNYLAFIFEVDPVQLRRYLQMVQSPLPFYQLGRESFLKSFTEGDFVGMNTAVRHSEPQSAATALYFQANPKQFNISFTCDDGCQFWNSSNCIEQWNQKDLARTEEILRCLQLAERFKQ